MVIDCPILEELRVLLVQSTTVTLFYYSSMYLCRRLLMNFLMLLTLC